MADKNSKVLVTGGSGYIGSELIPFLLKTGYKVRNLDLNLYGNACEVALKKSEDWEQWEPRYEFLCGDIRNPQIAKEALEGIDSVIHLAGISNDPTGDLDEQLTRQVNFDAVGMWVAMAREQGVQRFIHASSSSVYGYKAEEEITELLEPNPLSHYAKYKLLSEWVVRAANSAGFVTVCLRPATVCGVSPRQRFDLAVNKLTVDAIRKKTITVHGGAQRRPNVAMKDMVAIYGELLQAPSSKIGGQVFNFGFENLTIMQIAELIRDQLSDLEVQIEVVEKLDPRDFHMCSDKIREVLEYTPRSSIKDAVADLRRNLLELEMHEDEEAAEYYNLKSMKLDQSSEPYTYLGKKPSIEEGA